MYAKCPRCGVGRMVPMIMSTVCDRACEKEMEGFQSPSADDVHARLRADFARALQNFPRSQVPVPPPPSVPGTVPLPISPTGRISPPPAPGSVPPVPGSVPHFAIQAPMSGGGYAQQLVSPHMWVCSQYDLYYTVGRAPAPVQAGWQWLDQAPPGHRVLCINKRNPLRQVLVRWNHVEQDLEWRGATFTNEMRNVTPSGAQTCTWVLGSDWHRTLWDQKRGSW
jgi:hypothetical protein